MIVIVGCIVVVATVLAGFSWSGGHVGTLLHPAEVVTIGGAALGALIVMSPKKVIIDLMKGIVQTLKGSPYNKQAYRDLFKMLYDLFTTARRDGLLALEGHVSDPHQSSIFNKYPRIAKNHHVTEFICGALGPMIEGTVNPEQLSHLLETEMHVIEEASRAAGRLVTKNGRRFARFRHRGSRVGHRNHDGRDRRTGRRGRTQGRCHVGRYVPGDFGILRIRWSVR